MSKSPRQPRMSHTSVGKVEIENSLSQVCVSNGGTKKANIAFGLFCHPHRHQETFIGSKPAKWQRKYGEIWYLLKRELSKLVELENWNGGDSGWPSTSLWQILALIWRDACLIHVMVTLVWQVASISLTRCNIAPDCNTIIHTNLTPTTNLLLSWQKQR